MRTAVSIPDEVFDDAERLAKQLRKSRSELYSDALREYVSRHCSEHVTEVLNKVWGSVDAASETRFAASAGRRRVKREE